MVEGIDERKVVLVPVESCEPDGVFEDEYVYDIEIDTEREEDRVFFANGVAVHNSLFFSFEPVLKSCEWPADRYPDDRSKVLAIYNCLLDNHHTKVLDGFAGDYRVENIMKLKMEKYAESMIMLAKKSYIANVRWDEGREFESMEYVYAKGFDLVRSNTAPFTKGKLMNIIKYLFTNPDTYTVKELLKMLKEFRKEFEMMCTPQHIDEICLNTGTNKYSEHVLNDKTALEFKSGAGPGSKGAAAHNFMIQKDPALSTKYALIAQGDKVKYFYTKDPLMPVFAYLRGRYPYELGVEMDVDLQFDKTMLNIVNRLNKALDMQTINARLTMMFSLFDGLISDEEDDEEFEDDDLAEEPADVKDPGIAREESYFSVFDELEV